VTFSGDPDVISQSAWRSRYLGVLDYLQFFFFSHTIEKSIVRKCRTVFFGWLMCECVLHQSVEEGLTDPLISFPSRSTSVGLHSPGFFFFWIEYFVVLGP